MTDLAEPLAFARWIYMAGVAAAAMIAGSGLARARRVTGVAPLTLLSRPSAAELLRAAGVVVHAAIYVAGTFRPRGPLLAPVTPPTAATIGIGALLFGGGIALYAVTVATMGSAFRIGGDPGHEPRLVSHGPFARVRHPIYATMLVEGIGAALMYPCLFTLGALPLAWLGFLAQARREEALLLERLGQPYARYMEQTGRFVPRAGRGAGG